MANPRNYNVVLKGDSSAIVDGHIVTWKVESRSAKRQASDYSRNKPKGKWIPPKDYTMLETKSVEPNGSIYRTNLATGVQTLVRSGVVAQNTNGLNSSQNNFLRGQKVITLTETAVSPNLITTSQAKAWSALKNQQVNFGQAFAERKQTANLACDTIDRLCRDLIGVKKHLGPKKLARLGNAIVKDLPNYFLEVVFGWKPLLSDLHGAITELDNRDSSDWKVTCKGKAGVKEKGTFIYLSESAASAAQRYDYEISHGAYTRIDAVPENAALVKAAQLGLTNPLSLAWEVMPWSFAVDWIYPIGPYFDRLDSALGWNILGMSTSAMIKSKLTRTGLPMTTRDSRYANNWSSSWRFAKLNRGTGIVGPSEVFPFLKDPFSSAQRVGTMLSLLSQVRKGLRIR